jgi:hypothetical protein
MEQTENEVDSNDRCVDGKTIIYMNAKVSVSQFKTCMFITQCYIGSKE